MEVTVGAKAIGYVRVSRVGNRGGDSFLSPALQRESIERVCEREGLELVDVYEELDRSGGDSARPLWNRAIERVERGEAGALVVWNLSRFARSIIDAKRALERIEAAGGKLLSEEGAEGMSRDILLVVAEHERLRHADSFRRAGASAIERGIHFASRVPFGYTRDPDTRRLVPDENAPTVVGLFERRAKGWGWHRLVHWFVEQGGSPKTNSRAVTWVIRNRAYLGEARSGEFVNRKAHPPIVTKLLFDRANAVKGQPPKKDGSLTSHLLLGGLVFCAGCGHGMVAQGSSGRKADTGERIQYPSYGCSDPNCRARASIRGTDLDPFVVNAVFAVLRLAGTTGYRAPGTSPADLEEARRALEAAEYDRSKLVGNRELRRLLTADEYNAELVALSEAVEEARIALEMAEAQPEPPLQDVRGLWDEWTDETRGEWLREVIERVDVTSARRRRGVPVYERVRIGYRGLGDLEPTEADIAERRRRFEGFPGVRTRRAPE
jgi:site-specific DNA recombinase